jgi:hypothetical protein
MGLYIRDDRVRELARRLAEAQHVTVTEAVRQALEHKLSELRLDRAERERRIRESLARLDAMPQRPYGDDDMYDEFGNPR